MRARAMGMRVVALASALVLSQQSAMAQMSQGNGGGKFAGVEGAQDSAKDVMQRFVGDSRSTLDASAQLLHALELPQAEAEAGAQAKQIDSGMTRQESEQAIAAQLRAGNVSDLKRELHGIGEAARANGATVPQALLAN
jgi:hypothetical protein